MYGNKYATAFFITLADLTTCGRNILPSPNKSPTIFIPFIKYISITFSGLSTFNLASSTSSSIYASIPLISEWLILSCKSKPLHSIIFSSFCLSLDTVSAKSNSLSVASSLLFNKTSSTCFRRSLGISS